MSVQVLNDTNNKAPRIILIDENYCLNNSFDIIKENFDVLIEALNSLDENNVYFDAVLNRYNKNKTKYLEFMSYVVQFSADWIGTNETYIRNKNIWNNVYSTPLEFIYPTIIDISDLGTYKDGIITEVSNSSKKTEENVLNWVNSKYPPKLFSAYTAINMRFFVDTETKDELTFSANYTETCDTHGKSRQVCCDQHCKPKYGYRGCNMAIVDGHKQCANVFDWCPGTGENVEGFAGHRFGGRGVWLDDDDDGNEIKKSIKTAKECKDGSCVGWAKDSNRKKWKNRKLELSGKLSGTDRRLLGTFMMEFILTDTDPDVPDSDKKWKRKT